MNMIEVTWTATLEVGRSSRTNNRVGGALSNAAFFLYEAFKEDVCEEIVPLASYVTRLRRQVVDVAAKIVQTGGKTILKVMQATWRALNLKTLWDRAARPPSFAWQYAEARTPKTKSTRHP
jgi:hypothetical protein